MLEKLGGQTVDELRNDFDGASVWSDNDMIRVQTKGYSIVVTKFFGKNRSKSVTKTHNIDLADIKSAGESGVSKIIDGLIKDCNQASKTNFDSATFDSATGGKMVLNLFLQIKDPATGEWVDLPDDEMVDDEVVSTFDPSKPVFVIYGDENPAAVQETTWGELVDTFAPETEAMTWDERRDIALANNDCPATYNSKDEADAALLDLNTARGVEVGAHLHATGVVEGEETVAPTEATVEQPSEAEAYLQSIIYGKEDMFAADFAEKLTAMHEKCVGDEALMALFNSAVDTYSKVVMAKAAHALGGVK